MPPCGSKIDYALGNTELAPGRPRRRDPPLRRLSRVDRPGADLDGVRRDAAINRRFAEEQARRPSAPTDPARGGTSRTAASPSRNADADAREGGGAGSPADGSANDSPPGTVAVRGGAGGGGPAAAEAGSPEDQLSGPWTNVREARRRRIEETDEADDQDDRKDW